MFVNYCVYKYKCKMYHIFEQVIILVSSHDICGSLTTRIACNCTCISRQLQVYLHVYICNYIKSVQLTTHKYHVVIQILFQAVMYILYQSIVLINTYTISEPFIHTSINMLYTTLLVFFLTVIKHITYYLYSIYLVLYF